ncbi:uncharacterized protein [Coffea arabica]|uniref:Uncharacterized protein isoform X6 n=1 Tax=Coffea arabica TaxID=13443 RepID=A0ABM4VVK0_COFAR
MVYCFLGLPVSLSFACWISRCCFFFSCILFSFSAGASQKTSSEYFPKPLSLTEFLLAQPRQSSSSGQLFLLFSLLDLSLFFELASGKLFHLLFSHRWPQENFRPPFVVSALAVLWVLFPPFLDVMGIVVHAFPAQDVYMEGTMRHGRDYVIVDHSKRPILLTLWEDFESIEGCVIDEAMPTMPIIIAMRVRVLTENYISLSTQPSSVILVAPDVLEARELDCCVASFTRFDRATVWIKGRVEIACPMTRFWHLACPHCYHPYDFSTTLGIWCLSCGLGMSIFPRFIPCLVLVSCFGSN